MVSQGNLEIVSQDIIDRVSKGNLEIVSPENTDEMPEDSLEMVSQGNSEQQVEYIVMDESRMDNIIFIDQKTGQQVHLVQSGDHVGEMVMENLEVIDMKTVGGSDIQGVIAMPPEEESVAMETDGTELILEENIVHNDTVLQNDESDL
jgi:fructose-1,6-bisphosphatase/sedoheptulose 1,7-bisphosphatase-like protein